MDTGHRQWDVNGLQIMYCVDMAVVSCLVNNHFLAKLRNRVM